MDVKSLYDSNYLICKQEFSILSITKGKYWCLRDDINQYLNGNEIYLLYRIAKYKIYRLNFRNILSTKSIQNMRKWEKCIILKKKSFLIPMLSNMKKHC